MKQIGAIRALRWNYRWSGVWVWLKARHRLTSSHLREVYLRGWVLVLVCPTAVRNSQHALAEGIVL